MQRSVDASDDALLERLARAAFRYFRENTNPENGLVRDNSSKGSPCSIACVGFALSAYPVAVERGWMKRSEAVALTLASLRFLAESEQSEAPDASGFKGFYYHFLDMAGGKRFWRCELSLVDSALLFAGILTAAAFFTGDRAEEREIRERAELLFRKADWLWAQDCKATLTQGWKPEAGFLGSDWEGYNEALLLFVLALGSPTFPLRAASYANWTMTFQWEQIYGIEVLFAGPLFIHYFPQAWIDFRGIRDPFMRAKNSDYFHNTHCAVNVQREYCRRNPFGYEGYGADFWGVSAGDGPDAESLREDERDRRVYGYVARGIPFGPDDGTISPWAMPAALPFCRDAALAGTKNLLANFSHAVPDGVFASGFNPSIRDGDKPWRSAHLYGLDQGLLVMAIENARSGLIWELTRSCPFIRAGLEKADFRGGWLGGEAG